jgi:Flagellar protein FliT
MNPWVHAVELAERELALVRAGEWDLVAEVSDERARHTASLPQATEALRPLLERLAALEAALVETLHAARAATVRELGSLRRGRGAMRGYAGAAAPSVGGWVDHAA